MAQRHVTERLQTAITADLCRSLSQRGYAVVDNLFGAPFSEALRREIAALQKGRRLHPNQTHLVNKDGKQLLEKAHIYEAELASQAIQEEAPLLASIGADSTLRTMLSLMLPHLRLDAQSIKLQANLGSGGCFPMHTDTDAQLDGRLVTAIVYLNPRWRPGDGGELRLYPLPAPPVNIAPVHDRMVLFSAPHMVHRVLPSTIERFCFTVWLSQTQGRHRAVEATSWTTIQSQLNALEDGNKEAAWRFLMQPALRQHTCKLLHAQEWSQSLLESHPESVARQETVRKFWQGVNMLYEALAKPIGLIANSTDQEVEQFSKTVDAQWI